MGKKNRKKDDDWEDDMEAMAAEGAAGDAAAAPEPDVSAAEPELPTKKVRGAPASN